ncbi:MAG: glycosyltransferase family 2 protein [Ilumatobacter sp.]|nr:glycosyltransferase family 2 protein [Ilumatobacter sp.]
MTVAASIVVVTHRGVGETVWACLASLASASDVEGAPLVRTIVVDNGGGPITPAGDYGPGVDDVICVENRGFGAAANAGIRLARRTSAAPIALLNDDVEVDEGWLSVLLGALADNDRVGAVQPMLLRHGTDLINSVGVNLDRFAAGSDRGIGVSVGMAGAPSAIDIFTGGAVLFRAAFLDETGGFDERYFLYYEDVDLALRGAEMGWTYRCDTGSVVHHHGGATTEALGDDRVRYQERNRLWTAARFASPSMLARAFWLSICKLRHSPRGAHAQALAGGLAGLPGALVRRVAARSRNCGAIVSGNG